jgi:hypothetical protein
MSSELSLDAPAGGVHPRRCPAPCAARPRQLSRQSYRSAHSSPTPPTVRSAVSDHRVSAESASTASRSIKAAAVTSRLVVRDVELAGRCWKRPVPDDLRRCRRSVSLPRRSHAARRSSRFPWGPAMGRPADDPAASLVSGRVVRVGTARSSKRRVSRCGSELSRACAVAPKFASRRQQRWDGSGGGVERASHLLVALAQSRADAQRWARRSSPAAGSAVVGWRVERSARGSASPTCAPAGRCRALDGFRSLARDCRSRAHRWRS